MQLAHTLCLLLFYLGNNNIEPLLVIDWLLTNTILDQCFNSPLARLCILSNSNHATVSNPFITRHTHSTSGLGKGLYVMWLRWWMGRFYFIAFTLIFSLSVCWLSIDLQQVNKLFLVKFFFSFVAASFWLFVGCGGKMWVKFQFYALLKEANGTHIDPAHPRNRYKYTIKCSNLIPYHFYQAMECGPKKKTKSRIGIVHAVFILLRSI